MKTGPGSLVCIAVVSLVLLLSGCASQPGKDQGAVRQRFVPTPAPKRSESPRNGASWTALVPLNDGTGVSRLMAHAGIGEHFPVSEVDGRCLFEVFVVGGNDDQLLLEIRSVETPQRIELVRDKPAQLAIGGCKYDLAYPSIMVGAARNAKPTTHQAMILIHRRP